MLGLWRAPGRSPGSATTRPAWNDSSRRVPTPCCRRGRRPDRGTIIAGWDGWRANFYRLAVLPSPAAAASPSTWSTEAERRLAAKGARRLSAIVMSEHDPAVALWLAAGYTHDTRVGRYVRTLP